MQDQNWDIAVVGAGAAGLMAATAAAEQAPELKVACFDGAKKPGAKILVSGGGRCNVTNEVVRPDDFHGASAAALRKILRRFPVSKTIEFFAAEGVTLKREPLGKLFPEDDSARSVFDALLRAARSRGVALVHPRRIQEIQLAPQGFILRGSWGEAKARAVILATGGKSLPKSGSDGGGYALAAKLGVRAGERIFPALVPLRVKTGTFPTELAGISTQVRLSVVRESGKRLASVEGSMLCTHFGISGPAALDISRSWTNAAYDFNDTSLEACWLPEIPPEQIDQELQHLGGGSVTRYLRRFLPERLARAIVARADLEPKTLGHQLTRDSRRRLLQVVTADHLEVIGDRGWNHAEVTAGGVPLSALNLKTLETRACPGLYLCGEICDVEGRLGGFNFQWAWSSGFVAGSAAALSLAKSADADS